MSPRAAWAGVGFLLLLSVLTVGSLLAALGSLLAITAPDPLERDLVERGIASPGARVLAVHTHGEGAASCVLFDTEIVATARDGAPIRLPLDQVEIRTTERPLQVIFARGDDVIACPFRADEGIDTFVALARQAASRRRGRGWRPIDPRVRPILQPDAVEP